VRISIDIEHKAGICRLVKCAEPRGARRQWHEAIRVWWVTTRSAPLAASTPAAAAPHDKFISRYFPQGTCQL